MSTIALPIDGAALPQLTFDELLPPELAVRCLSVRQGGVDGATRALSRSAPVERQSLR